MGFNDSRTALTRPSGACRLLHPYTGRLQHAKAGLPQIFYKLATTMRCLGPQAIPMVTIAAKLINWL